jgi:nucleoside-diphosphate-sugar epimerase
MSIKPRVLVTGAFGTIGREAVPHLLRSGCEVVAFDLQTPEGRRVEARLRNGAALSTRWGDISDGPAVARVVRDVAPGCILHLASLIPPGIYVDEARSRRINLLGTEQLLRAARALNPRPHFVFASSHTVHGYRNGVRDLPLLAPDDPRNACDLYTRIKIRCEDLLRDSGLPWTILRYGIAFPKVYSRRIDPAAVRLSYLVPLQSRSHGIHSDDAGLAAARAATVRPEGKVLMIGGGEAWKQRQRFFIENILEAVGVGMLPEAAYYQPDPGRDESWFYNDWLDTAEGQALLGYQRHEPGDYFEFLARDMGWLRPLARLAAPLVRRRMARLSPFLRGVSAPEPADSTLEQRIELYAPPAARA